MSLDIRFYEKRAVNCPHCGKIVAMQNINCQISSGREWYGILERIGYYVPHDKVTEETNWYGKDMGLTAEQAEEVYWYIEKHRNIYNGYAVSGLIARALLEKNCVVVNADW